MNPLSHDLKLALAAMNLDELPERTQHEMKAQLARCIGDVLAAYPHVTLTKEPDGYCLQCSRTGFVLAHEARAFEAWFSAHADWTPSEAFC